jgi:hypothetical protein
VRPLLAQLFPTLKSAAEQVFRDARLAHVIVAEVTDMVVDKLRLVAYSAFRHCFLLDEHVTVVADCINKVGFLAQSVPQRIPIFPTCGTAGFRNDGWIYVVLYSIVHGPR